MPRKLSPKVAKTLLDAGKRQAKAVDLYLQGMSLRKIAIELGYAGPSGAHKAIRGAIAKVPSPEVNELRSWIDESTRELLPVFFRKAQRGDTDASKEWREHVAVLRKVHGVDSKQEIDISGSLSLSHDVHEQLLDRLARLAAASGAGEARSEPVSDGSDAPPVLLEGLGEAGAASSPRG